MCISGLATITAGQNDELKITSAMETASGNPDVALWLLTHPVYYPCMAFYIHLIKLKNSAERPFKSTAKVVLSVTTTTTTTTTSAAAPAIVRKHVMIKFTRRYGIEAHALLAQRHFAPRLYYVCTLRPDWVVVIMEWLEITPYYMCIQQQQQAAAPAPPEQQVTGNNPPPPRMSKFKESLEEAVTFLHGNGLVHGDLRTPNIGGIPVPGSSTDIHQAVLVDFDWSGPHGRCCIQPT
ncbi:hypothetical protein Pelo_11586 [Pelomyxa schiedti]|nr:hypothetical protein Pelo_11586 [Pelomyxa schiedti]